MPTDDKTIAQLHQRASSHYLQGEFDQALVVWRELLALDSADERALEGVRLCELLADDGETAPAPAAPTSAASPASPTATAPAAATTPPAAKAAPEETAPAAPAVAPSTARDLPDPAIQGEGIDMGDHNDVDALPLAGARPQAPPPTTPAADLDFDFDIPEAPPVAEEQAAAENPATGLEEVDPASAQLNQRIEELYDDALELYEQGQGEAAMGLLCRLFILDESNAKAQTLQEKIHADAEAARSAEVAAAAEPAEDLLTQAAAPEAAADLLGEVRIDAPAPPGPDTAAGELELDDSELQAPGSDSAPGAGADLQDAEGPALEAPRSAPATAPRARRRAPIPKGLALGLSGVALLAVGVFVWLQFFAGAAAPAGAEDADSGIASIKDRVGPNAEAAATDAEAAPTEAASAGEAVEEAPQDLDTLLAQARTAFDGADYASAVLAYNKVLEIDPENTEAVGQLKVAGERYREQHEQQQRWEDTIQMFNEGNYRGALQALYRIESDDPAKLERYKRNAWFNMALISLTSGDCKTAQSHFEEARAIDPGDAETARGIELCQACQAQPGDRSWYSGVHELHERGLED